MKITKYSSVAMNIEVGTFVYLNGTYGVVLEKHEGCVNEGKESTLFKVGLQTPGRSAEAYSIVWASSDKVSFF